MTVLRRLAIRHYRSIVRCNLQLGLITVVVGPSDAGKTNIVRALRDWAYNVGGYGFVSQGSSETRIAVAVSGHHKVMFEKSIKSGSGAETGFLPGLFRPGFGKLGLNS